MLTSHWKLVQRYEVFLKLPNFGATKSKKSLFSTFFSNFLPFSFFISNLFLTFANDIASRVATLAHQPAYS
jgi:hypothetical protein